MKVRCIKNKLADFSDDNIKAELRKKFSYDDDQEIDINIGSEYTVYGIMLGNLDISVPYYYICSEESDSYPKSYPSILFEITDNKPSQYWHFYHFENLQQCQLGFPEFCEELYFYTNLVDGEEREESIFRKYRNLMDEESDIL